MAVGMRQLGRLINMAKADYRKKISEPEMDVDASMAVSIANNSILNERVIERGES